MGFVVLFQFEEGPEVVHLEVTDKQNLQLESLTHFLVAKFLHQVRVRG